MGELMMHQPLIRLAESGIVRGCDIDELQTDVFPNGLQTRADAEMLLAIDMSAFRICDQWDDYLISAIADFTIVNGVVNVKDAEWLERCVARQGVVHSKTGFELLFTIIAHAKKVPFALAKLAMDQVALAALENKGPLADMHSGENGGISAREASLLREILVACESGQQISLSHEEMNYLQKLHAQTRVHLNDPLWNDLHVKAAANYVLSSRADLIQSRGVSLATPARDAADDIQQTSKGTLKSLERANEACGGGEDIIRIVSRYQRDKKTNNSGGDLMMSCLSHLKEQSVDLYC